jgi:hypothetical protein
MIDLYSLDRVVTVKYLIPQDGELGSHFGHGPEEVQGWRMLVETLKRNLDEVVEINERRWWRPEQARFKAGDRVRMVGRPNFPTPVTGTIAASPLPRRIQQGVLYRIQFDEPQVGERAGLFDHSDALEEFLQPLTE